MTDWNVNKASNERTMQSFKRERTQLRRALMSSLNELENAEQLDKVTLTSMFEVAKGKARSLFDLDDQINKIWLKSKDFDEEEHINDLTTTKFYNKQWKKLLDIYNRQFCNQVEVSSTSESLPGKNNLNERKGPLTPPIEMVPPMRFKDVQHDVYEEAEIGENKHYQDLLALNNVSLVLNLEKFQCPICFSDVEAGEGAILQECLHSFCKECLANVVKFSETPVVKCPFRDEGLGYCDGYLLEKEIKFLVTPEMYERHLQKSVTLAENQAPDSFHCKTPDCSGWCFFEDNVNTFECPVCKQENCLNCSAIHNEMSCQQYQEKIFLSDKSEEATKTKEYFENMVKTGQVMRCPKCKVYLEKIDGCNILRCLICRANFLWTGGRLQPRNFRDPFTEINNFEGLLRRMEERVTALRELRNQSTSRTLGNIDRQQERRQSRMNAFRDTNAPSAAPGYLDIISRRYRDRPEIPTDILPEFRERSTSRAPLTDIRRQRRMLNRINAFRDTNAPSAASDYFDISRRYRDRPEIPTEIFPDSSTNGGSLPGSSGLGGNPSHLTNSGSFAELPSWRPAFFTSIGTFQDSSTNGGSLPGSSGLGGNPSHLTNSGSFAELPSWRPAFLTSTGTFQGPPIHPVLFPSTSALGRNFSLLNDRDIFGQIPNPLWTQAPTTSTRADQEPQQSWW